MPVRTIDEGMGFTNKLKLAAKGMSGKSTLKAGWLSDSEYPNETPVAAVAYIHEYGAPAVGIPPRPTFRPTIKKQQDYWIVIFRKALKANNYNAGIALAALGEAIKGDVQEAIQTLEKPALSPVTIMLRLMKKINSYYPFGKNGKALKRRQKDRADRPFVVNKTTVEEARRLVEQGKIASGISEKPLIETGTMLKDFEYLVDSDSGYGRIVTRG